MAVGACTAGLRDGDSLKDICVSSLHQGSESCLYLQNHIPVGRAMEAML